MTELRRYRLDQIAAGIRNLDAYLRGDKVRKDALLSDADAADLASAGEVAEVLGELLFRDERGDYWALNPFSRQWYRWQGGAWEPTSAPERPVEGPEALLTSLGLDVEIPDRRETSVDDPLPEMAASQSLAALVRRLGAAYRDGRISSEQATDLLGRLVLVTRHGDVWTMGVSSEGWYLFEDGQWSPRDTPPDDDELLTRSELAAWSLDEEDEASEGAVGEGVGEALAAFLFGAAGALPEPITLSWEPPSEAPPVWPRCPACGRENLPGYRLCAWCGAAAPPPMQEEASWMQGGEHPAVPEELLACPACGAARRPEQAFCEECGARLAQIEPVTPPPPPPEARLCQKCGAQAGPGDHFCGNCGAPLG